MEEQEGDTLDVGAEEESGKVPVAVRGTSLDYFSFSDANFTGY